MRTILPHELDALMEQDSAWLIIDTRSADRYADGHIPGAHHVSADAIDLVHRVMQITTDRSDTVVVYSEGSDCGRAGSALQRLLRAGFLDVRVLDGGLRAWSGEGLEVTPESVTTS